MEKGGPEASQEEPETLKGSGPGSGKGTSTLQTWGGGEQNVSQLL